jgi:hypothetical protein
VRLAGHKRKRHDPSPSLEEQMQAVKHHRSAAVAVARASSVLTYGLEVSANDANRFLGVDAFVTLAKLGQPAQAERLCRLLATFSYLRTQHGQD